MRNPPDVYDRMDSAIRQFLYLGAYMKQAGDMRYQRPAILRAFCRAYEDKAWTKLGGIIAANPDIFPIPKEGRLYIDEAYEDAKTELGEAGSSKPEA